MHKTLYLWTVGGINVGTDIGLERSQFIEGATKASARLGNRLLGRLQGLGLNSIEAFGFGNCRVQPGAVIGDLPGCFGNQFFGFALRGGGYGQRFALFGAD